MSGQPTRRHPWPPDRWPTPAELVEYSRISPTAEVMEYFDQLLRHASRGRACLLRGDDTTISMLEHALAEVVNQRDRARLAAKNARRRAADERRRSRFIS